MKSSRLATILSLVLTLAFTTAAVAGPTEPQEVKKIEPTQRINPGDGTTQQYLQAARARMRKHNYEGAAGLLESIYQKEPDNQIALNLLRNCYNQMGQPAKSELIVRRLLELSPNSWVLRMYLAESIAAQGKPEHAAAVYDSTLAVISNDDPGIYRQIITNMHGAGMDRKALDLINELRVKLNQPDLMALNAGEIQESAHHYGEAADEFFVAAADTSRLGIEAESRLLGLLDFEESFPPAEKAVLKCTTGPEAARAARILSVHYLKHDRTDQAMKYVLLQDSIEGGNGLPLLMFMRTCHDLKKYDRVETVARELLRRYGVSPLLSDVRFLYGDALTHLGRYTAAIANYDTIMADYERMQDKSEAGYRVGAIYLDYLNQPDSALKMFDSVTATFRGGLGYLNALLAKPFCYLRQGKLAKARTEFEQNMGSRLTDDSQEQITYYLALLDFFDGQYDTTRAALNRLMVDYPRGFYVNDALQLLLVMDEAQDTPALLDDWSRALQYAERRLPDSLRDQLTLIADNDNPTLADIALYRLAQLSLEQLDSSAAVGYIDTLAARYPESYYMPFGLKLKGDMYLADPATAGEGRDLYRRLLEEFGNYPFTTEVRKKLRELEDSRVG